MKTLAQKLAHKTAICGVIGLGYVGLPLVRRWLEVGFRVMGFDIDPAKVRRLRDGESYIQHIPGGWIRRAVAAKRFIPTDDFSRLSEPDVIIICVPTPLAGETDPDLSCVLDTARAIRKTLRKNQLVILESTTYPGTTSQEVLPILERSGLREGKDFFLAYSPEREDPGNPEHSIGRIPKLVGGRSGAATRLAAALYGKIVPQVVAVSSLEVAEAAKILENVYRAVNIALVNELKIIFDRMGIDVWEVIRAASTKPFGFKPFYPGPGLGGHCIPIDPFYLSWKAKQYGVPARFIELAGKVNSRMPDYVVSRLKEALKKKRGKKTIRGARILLLGIAYKENVDDLRESPALKLIHLLADAGAEVRYHDPFVARARSRRHRIEMDSTHLTKRLLMNQDAVLIVTAHREIDYGWVVRNSRLVVDTRNATALVRTGREKIVKA